MSRLKEKYSKEIVPVLQKQFGYKNVMQAPRLIKVMVSMGVGDGKDDPKLLEAAVKDLAIITGQKAKTTRSTKSVAAFRLRKGQVVGAVVTLRGERMYEFIDRLFNIALPRIRDFQGLPERAFDGRGNYTLGLREQTMFPEIKYDQVVKVRGMDITLCTTAKTDEESAALLLALGLPLRRSA